MDESITGQVNAEDVGGQNKCPKCGATDISLNVSKGLLRCNFCRHEFEPEKAEGSEKDLSKLEGTVIGAGASDIIADTNEVLTFKCSSCAAEVVIDTATATQARCHWCRNTLSINQQIPNGAVPDVVLPFKIKKEEAKAGIEDFVGKRKFFAHPQFKKEFSAENVMGVYLPYMVVDVNAHASLSGQGEHEVRRYTHGSGKDKETLYDADLYNVEREFDIIVDGLTVESSADKRGNDKTNKKTNNIINSIMPFDTENSVKWDANYLKGYTSEKRDTNVEQLKDSVNTQAKDIARHKANDSLKQYNRGVQWTEEHLDVKGQQWKAAYLPVWLYSYHQPKKNLLHYVAVNARTKETMGSVPIHFPKLLGVSAIVEIIGIILWLITMPLFANSDDGDFSWIFLFAGFVYYGVMYARYRNKGARHHHEKETKAILDKLRESDTFVEHRTALKNAKMKGANNTTVKGSLF
jgi:Adenine-specific DNA methylase containing a Zn-ribbon